MRRRHDSVDQRAAVDVALELRFSAQPGPVFVPGSAYSVPAEVVSAVRQMLTRMVGTGEWPQAVALTSALRKEGVSYTALSLGAVLSQDTTRSVCLVDTNWYWPSVPVIDAGDAPDAAAQSGGLAAVLDGEIELDRALVRVEDSTAVNGALFANGGAVDERRGRAWPLALLPAGQMTQSRRVMAARSPELKAVIAELRERFEYLVLDVPPVLATSDAIALAGLADACCLVVHQGVTPTAVVQEALGAIRHLPVMGVIMNHVRVHMPAGLAGQLVMPVTPLPMASTGAGQAGSEA